MNIKKFLYVIQNIFSIFQKKINYTELKEIKQINDEYDDDLFKINEAYAR